MKIYDITKFTSKTDYKPELATIYLTHTDTGIRYATTDSFRLIEVTFEDEAIKEVLKEGFYLPSQWKFIAKETAKEFPSLSVLLNINPISTEYQFPDYRQIIPKELEEVSYPFNRFDIHLLKDFTDLIEKITKKKYFEFLKDLKQSSSESKMLYYQGWDSKGNSEIKMMLMPINK